jgi:hypothetical protein
MWLEKGTIVSTVNRQGVTDKQSANNRALTKKPMVILVDGGSASASEILSGALQDNNRGVLVGTKTFGKGLVQSVRGLNDGSGLAVTIAKYLTPSGRDINKNGIEPDVVFDLSEEQKLALRKDNTKIGTPDDPQYVKGLEILRKEIVGKQVISDGDNRRRDACATRHSQSLFLFILVDICRRVLVRFSGLLLRRLCYRAPIVLQCRGFFVVEVVGRSVYHNCPGVVLLYTKFLCFPFFCLVGLIFK